MSVEIAKIKLGYFQAFSLFPDLYPPIVESLAKDIEPGIVRSQALHDDPKLRPAIRHAFEASVAMLQLLTVPDLPKTAFVDEPVECLLNYVTSYITHGFPQTVPPSSPSKNHRKASAKKDVTIHN